MTFLDALASLLLMWFGYRGYKKGIIEEIGYIVGLVGSIVLTLSWYISLCEFLVEWVPFHGYLLIGTAVSLLFFPLLLLFRLGFKLLEFIISSTKIASINKWFGVLPGVVKGVLILAMVVWSIEIIDHPKWSNIIQSNLKFSSKITDMRIGICHHFGWTDPIVSGKIFLKQWIKKGQKK